MYSDDPMFNTGTPFNSYLDSVFSYIQGSNRMLLNVLINRSICNILRVILHELILTITKHVHNRGAEVSEVSILVMAIDNVISIKRLN